MKTFRHVFALVPDCHARMGHYRTLWKRHFYEGLQGAVERVTFPENIEFRLAREHRQIDPTQIGAQRDEIGGKLLEQIECARREHGLDAVISYCFADDIPLELVRTVIGKGVPWINFYCDSTHLFEGVEALARVVSLNWFVERAAIPSYQGLNVPSVCLPYALNPDYLPDCVNRVPKRSAAFIGLPTANRITQLGWLKWHGCPVEVRGHGWVGEAVDPFRSPVPLIQRLAGALTSRGLGEKLLRRLFWPGVRPLAKGPIEDAELAEFLRESIVLLGLNQGRDTQGRLMSYLKFRDVEFAGYGCCYLTEHNEDVTGIFDPGREVLTYRTMREAAGLIREMGRAPEKARQIGEAGRRRVLAEHTWSTRLRQLAAAI